MTTIIDFSKALEKEKEDNRELLDLTNKKFSDLITASERIAENCKDYIVKKANSSNVRLNELANISYISQEGNIHSSPISRHALMQLGNKIGVPARYLEKCIQSGRIDLAQDNVNSWLSGYDKDLFIREHEGRIRGVLSTKYSVCDTHELLNVVQDKMDLKDYTVKGYFLSPERFHVRLVQNEKLNVEGEDLFAGITIDSSDVGRSNLTCNFLVYKQVCTNGLILSKGSTSIFRQRHIGITEEEFKSGFAYGITLVPKIVAEVEKQIEKTRLHTTYNFLTHASDELEEIVNTIRLNTLLSEESAQKVVSIMKDGKYGNNRWGYINALTEVAQDLSLEKRISLEKYAGGLLLA